MPRRNSPWPEREEELRLLFHSKHPDGTPYGAHTIGRLMGLTASAVAGKLNRMGLNRGSRYPKKEEGIGQRNTKAVKVQPHHYARGEPTLPPLPSLTLESKKV